MNTVTKMLNKILEIRSMYEKYNSMNKWGLLLEHKAVSKLEN